MAQQQVLTISDQNNMVMRPYTPQKRRWCRSYFGDILTKLGESYWAFSGFQIWSFFELFVQWFFLAGIYRFGAFIPKCKTP